MSSSWIRRSASALLAVLIAGSAPGVVSSARASPDFGRARPTAVVVSPEQSLRIDLGDGRGEGEGRFRFNIRVFPEDEADGEGEADGQMRLEVRYESGYYVVLNVNWDSGSLTRSDEVSFEGAGKICPSEGECEPLLVTGTVQTHTSHDCLIYDVVGPNVGGKSTKFEGRGRFVLLGM